MYSSSVSFDSVVVIESLPAGDLRTGRELYETTLVPANFNDPGLLAELRTVHHRRELIAALAEVHRWAQTYGRSPIVHLEMHGSEAGLALASGDRLEWLEVASALAKINHASRLNLLVVAALCHGWYMIDILRPIDRAPAYGIIGTAEKIPSGLLLASMQRLYERLLQPPYDLTAALQFANGHLEQDGELRMINAELMLCRVFSHYVDNLEAEESVDERVIRLVADMAYGRRLDVQQTMVLRQAVRSDLDDLGKWFNHYRTRFLMLDEFAENVSRFGLTYDDCRSLMSTGA